jgi:sugar phosphate permease
MFRPAINAALPSMVPPADRSRLIALFYAAVNTGLMLGPALAALMLLFASAQDVLLVNAFTFVTSALLLAGVDLGPRSEERPPEDDQAAPESVWAQTWTGARVALEIPGVAVVMVVGALVVLTGAMFNVLAPLLATGPLRVGGTGYSVLWAFYGTGMVAGSWVNSRAGSDLAVLRRRWLFGIVLSGLAMTGAAVAPDLGFALVAFVVVGLAENLLVGPEMRLVQELVSERFLGRVFGFKDVLENIAFASAFVGAGALLSLAGVRVVFALAGLVTMALALFGALKFRLAPSPEPEPALAPTD